ncbi:MAG: SLC13 family permease [Bacillota bacterium]|uniref:SLC13 family permease n=1 Tax=Desulforudis sp. DRI-14 TaxID=3459793 RepID=UPI003472496A
MTTPVLNGKSIDWRKTFFLLLGLALFFLFYFAPPFAPVHDPTGKEFALPKEGQRAIGLFLMAGIWWVFEVIPIGVTAITIGVFQGLWGIRKASDAFHDFMDPSVLFILGALFIGLAFSKSGLTKRVAFKMIQVAGEDTRIIMGGVFLITMVMTWMMAHTAVAAAMFPILMVILSLYGEEEKPTRFGKGLFIGMAWAAGAGSIMTMMGGARNPAAVGLFQEFTGQEISFLTFSKYMFPIGFAMVVMVWLLCVILFRPEKTRIVGVRDKVNQMAAQMGPITRNEIFVAVVTAIVLGLLVIQQFVPALEPINRSVLLLLAGLVFFIFNFFDVEDLEKRVPWNIILLFSGAMSIGFCLWKTGAAEWMAVGFLALFVNAHWLVFVLAISALVMVLTNFIMNVAAIAITLPIALVVASYLGINPQVILFAAVAMAGVPYMLLIGAAPNAIAYQSKQFTTGEFFSYGIIPSIISIGILAVMVLIIWPLMGMPGLLK